MFSDAPDDLLKRLQALYAVTQALMAYADRAPPSIKEWAERELLDVCAVLERLAPVSKVSIGAAWPLKR